MKPTYREKNLLDYLFEGFRSTFKERKKEIFRTTSSSTRSMEVKSGPKICPATGFTPPKDGEIAL